MNRLALGLAVAAMLTGCSAVSRQHPVASVQELAGEWHGRLALQLANAAATMTIKENGAYQGALHLDGGEDRPFNGAITVVRPGRVRYQGSHGNGIVMLMALKILEGFDLRKLGHNTPDYLHLLVEALKLAFADRHRYIADPRFSPEMPVSRLLSGEYAASRRSLRHLRTVRKRAAVRPAAAADSIRRA